MQEQSSNEVNIAFEILLEEIESVVDSLNKEGASALEQGDYDAARRAIEEATRLTSFRQKVKDLQKAWQQTFSRVHSATHSHVSHTSSATKRQEISGRLSKGLRTPEQEFWRPILEALVELGGSAPMSQVLDRVEHKMKSTLNEYDYGHLSSGAVRWRNAAQWARLNMINHGLLKSDSPRGTWEITEKGRRAVESGEI